ncbi:2-succinyl-5-enolpyruvyl-6-hydroxy-3-cyclohexene-1-carboxylic-acid synthase [Oceanobacillus jordanicus]|uniref:2-succinyl-5-enolpyruvyl-6-hydroxy-3-cyclohexene-1-carboxylate synthase n=1 Tax=Oceanobacillus jordanicus TaxID=2867266 RepID=A0AAW5B8P7_9BACI|nr:2-succinyl-5-enolpyruvyl-6-hydroxy-3-cyclohexene-1-carboxylic-acid synthase [Oceanobacillus jordanicus]MCG3419599.1 2-succinyl-5-enolpyruvyl-6-hydroxy-3-cyclohexene-1-carboxylic-acid synthase [Oceanobacillus jordanicus]
MNPTEVLTRYTANFVDELSKNGVTDIVISPGSRSTPLAMTIAEHSDIKEWIVIDERSAAFFAMGIAKKTGRAVALVCTSGTAAANYFPAIVEANYSRVPLIVLTADRPHELRDIGAPQAIEQLKLYGDYVKWFQEMALPEASENMLSYVRNKSARAVFMANEGNPGPVQLNFPFRDPLVPDFSIENLWSNQSSDPRNHTVEGKKQLSTNQITSIIEKLKGKGRGLIVCGPQTDQELAQAVTQVAEAWGLPILADPLSQLRAGEHAKDLIVETYDAIFRDEKLRNKLRPDYIIRFGAMPVSKPYLFYVNENKHIPQFVVENYTGFREPTGNNTEFIFSDAVLFCKSLLTIEYTPEQDKEWLEGWQSMNRIAKKHLLAEDGDELTEGEAVRALVDVIPESSSIYVGNSMAVRDLDTFFFTTPKHLFILANRGANGIDGMVSSGLGAAITGAPVTLVVGDLSFYHDLNALLIAKQYKLNITILLINNNGGGIFSFLPQSQEKKHFEVLFGTPVDIEFKHAVQMYGGMHASAGTEEELKAVLYDSYQHKGLSVVEVKTDRETNTSWHRSKWKAIAEELKGEV